MVFNDLPRELVQALRPADIARYVESRGWRPVQGTHRLALVFQHPSSELDQVIVPTEEVEADSFALLMREVVRNLSLLEQRPARDVLTDLLVPDADVLHVRLSDDNHRRGM